MKGRSVSADQKRFHDMLCREIGCIACSLEGIFTPYVSVHHVEGRTKPWAHWMVLPLCGPHHQDAGIPGVIAVHPWKSRFEVRYGNQANLVRECIQILIDRGCNVPQGAIEAAFQKQSPATPASAPGLSTAHA